MESLQYTFLVLGGYSPSHNSPIRFSWKVDKKEGAKLSFDWRITLTMDLAEQRDYINGILLGLSNNSPKSIELYRYSRDREILHPYRCAIHETFYGDSMRCSYEKHERRLLRLGKTLNYKGRHGTRGNCACSTLGITSRIQDSIEIPARAIKMRV